jgi:surface protein
MREMFYFTSFNGDVSNWDVTSLSGGGTYRLFGRSAFNRDLSNWDVSNWTSMTYVFEYSPFNNDSIANWNTSNVTTMRGLFNFNTQFNQDISGWDTSSVTDMSAMFTSAISFNQPIGSWNTSNVTNMASMLNNADSFDQPIDSWDTSSVIDMGSMFRNAAIFNQDLSGWDVSNVTKMNAMFMERGNAPDSNLNISGWTTSSLTTTDSMFKGTGGNTQDLSAWDMSNNTNYREMFYFGRINFNPSAWNPSPTNLTNAFLNATTVAGNVDTWNFSGWDVTNLQVASGFTSFTLTTANYDATLVAWEAQLQAAYPGGVGYTPINSIRFGASQYTLGGAAETARASLINTFGWTITDGGGVAQAPFVFTVNALNFTIPIDSTYTYNYDISTSDGQVITGNTGGTTINFPSSGVYDIEITGTFPAIKFNNGGYRNLIIDIKSWGAIEWKSFVNAFLGCVNMTCTATDRPYLFTPINFQGAFQNCVLFNPPSIVSWNVSNVTSFYNTFSGARSFNQDISGWNVSNVTTFRNMFNNTTTNNMAFNQPIGSWDVSGTVSTNVFRDMFYGCNNFDQDLSAWDISGLPYATGNFNNFITSGDLVNFPVGLSRDNYDALLIGWAAQAPTQGEIISFGTSQYTLGGAAEAARNTLVNTYNWTITDGGGVNVNFEFTINTALQGGAGSGTTSFQLPLVSTSTVNATVDWGDGTVNTITAYNDPNALHTYASTGTYNISISGTLNGWSTNAAPSFKDDRRKITNISNWGCFDVTEPAAFVLSINMNGTATDAPTITSTNLDSMFNQCYLWNAPIDQWDVSNVISMVSMFYQAYAFNQPLNSWDVSSVTNMASMFRAATSFNQSLNSWDVSSVTDMINMFAGATAFNGDITSWQLTANPRIQSMFDGASAFNQPIGSWDTAGVTAAQWLFRNAISFDQSLANWDITTIFAFDWFGGAGLSTANYDATLIGWESQSPPQPKTANFGSSQYTLGSAAETARTSLINTYGWTIIDGGGI